MWRHPEKNEKTAAIIRKAKLDNLSAFLSSTVVNVLVEYFNIKPIVTVAEDIEAMVAGKYYTKRWL